jgi:LacI family transcriptional regulator
MVTQKEVAKKAGVSFITVSRVLNNKGYVKKETREKILKTIEDLDYYTNHIGQALRKKNVKTIGIVIPEPPHVPVHGADFYNMLLAGIDRFIMAHEYDMLLSSYSLNDVRIDYLRLFFQKKVDGLILFLPDMRYLKTSKITENNIPCVIVGERTKDKKISFVDADNFDGMFRITDYLLARGFKKLAFIKGIGFMQCSVDRYRGFLKAMKKHNIAVDPDLIIEGDFTNACGAKAIETLIARKKLPDGILCSNDLMALGVLSHARNAGIRIPEKMSIVGFDDINITEYTDPPLSTIRQPLFEMGYHAAEILFNSIKNPGAPIEQKIFPVELIMRKSIKQSS